MGKRHRELLLLCSRFKYCRLNTRSEVGNSSPLGLLFDHGCDALGKASSACTFAIRLDSKRHIRY